jgi:hypothetical protein
LPLSEAVVQQRMDELEVNTTVRIYDAIEAFDAWRKTVFLFNKNLKNM